MSKHTVYKKKRNKNSLPVLPVAAVALVAVIVVGIALAINKKPNQPENPVQNSEVSSQEQQVTPVSYEERVGKEYAIDIEEYLQYIEPEDKYEYVFLVNPTHTLASDYVPDDLVDCGYTRNDGRATQKMRKSAAKALQAFLAEGKAVGEVENVTVTSAYRSYDYQDYLFNEYCNQHQYKFKTREECEKYVLTFSTKPGTSEHQSGLCCDMHNISSAEVTFAQKPEAKWLAENCYRFGFILRYPEDKTDITGITFEPWHFRFVGREAATEMHELGLCLEEYVEYLNK